jgi:hypothetical protein
MRAAIAWGVFVVVTGCGGNGPDISTTQDNVCDQVASVACFDMYQCCAEGEIERFLGVSDPRTIDQCHEDVQTLCERQLAQINFSVKNKHLKFDSKIMNDCLDLLVAPDGTCVTVSSMLPWTDACMASAWTGAVGDGDACDFADECSKDSFCNTSRVCTTLPGDGMPCGVQGCATGLYCATTCHPLLAVGGTCTLSTQCQKGLFCDTVDTHVCTPLHAVGEACNGNNSCTSETCLPGTCANSTISCTSATSCAQHCADNNAPCGVDANCGNGLGICSVGGAACSVVAPCAGVGNMCVFPVKCQHDACLGNVVCAEAHTFVDYCQGAISALPLFREQNFEPGR